MLVSFYTLEKCSGSYKHEINNDLENCEGEGYAEE